MTVVVGVARLVSFTANADFFIKLFVQVSWRFIIYSKPPSIIYDILSGSKNIKLITDMYQGILLCMVSIINTLSLFNSLLNSVFVKEYQGSIYYEQNRSIDLRQSTCSFVLKNFLLIY